MELTFATYNKSHQKRQGQVIHWYLALYQGRITLRFLSPIGPQVKHKLTSLTCPLKAFIFYNFSKSKFALQFLSSTLFLQICFI